MPDPIAQPEGPDRPDEDDERAIDDLIERLKALMRSPRACREYYWAYLGVKSAHYFLFAARCLGRSPVRPGEFPEFCGPE